MLEIPITQSFEVLKNMRFKIVIFVGDNNEEEIIVSDNIVTLQAIFKMFRYIGREGDQLVLRCEE